MPWRAGWICGNKDVVKQLATVKDNFDSGVFEVVQAAGIAALTGPQECVDEMRKLYKDRRDVFVPAMKKLGWDLNTPEATFYVWARTPNGLSSMETVTHILENTGVLCTPGNGFGPSGEGYVRFALTVEKPRLDEALSRLSKLHW
jgi:LL-diaminopimelate aminotransferase